MRWLWQFLWGWTQPHNPSIRTYFRFGRLGEPTSGRPSSCDFDDPTHPARCGTFNPPYIPTETWKPERVTPPPANPYRYDPGEPAVTPEQLQALINAIADKPSVSGRRRDHDA